MSLNPLLTSFFFLQLATSSTPGTTPTTESKSLFDIILGSSTSGLIVITVLFLLSIVAVYIIVERYMTLTRAGQVDHNFMNSIRSSVESGNLQAARR